MGSEEKKKPQNIDIVSLKKKKRRRRQMLKYGAIIAVVIIAVVIYKKKDDWFPGFDGTDATFKSVRNNELSDDNFPLSISGGIDYQVKNLNDDLAILSDAYFYIYDSDGDLCEERQHSYANAMMQTANRSALIYESGGTHLRVDTKHKKVFEKKLDNKILFARLSSNGNVAVVTSADTFVCKLIVFNDSGDEIYSRDCVERVMDIDFSPDGKGCVLATAYASNGSLQSKLLSVSFDSKEDNWESQPFDTMCLKTYYSEEGIFMLGEDSCAFCGLDGGINMTYDYPSTLVDWDRNDRGVALLFKNDAKRCGYFTTISVDKKTPNENIFDGSTAKCIRLADDNVLVMNDRGICKYGFKGSDPTEINNETAYDRFIIIDDHIFLLGYDRIDKAEYDDK